MTSAFIALRHRLCTIVLKNEHRELVRDRVRKSALNSPERQRDDNQFPGTEKLVQSCVCGRSVGTGKSLRGIENQLAMKHVDDHNMHISDERYIGKGLKNLGQKLILLESGQIHDQKTCVLIWDYLCQQR